MKSLEAVCRKLVAEAHQCGMMLSDIVALQKVVDIINEIDNIVPADPVYATAVKAIKEKGRVSVTLIARRCSCTYKQAAALIERLEADGLVGPIDKMGDRVVLAQ